MPRGDLRGCHHSADNNTVFTVSYLFLPKFVGSVLSGTERFRISATTDIPYHLVITTAGRHHASRHLALTLLSALMHEARPASLTLLVGEHYNNSAFRNLSLVKTFRDSGALRVVYVPDSVPERNTKYSYYFALRVPDDLGSPHLPLVIIEDDVFLAPNFGDMFSAAYRKAHWRSERFMLSLYVPGMVPQQLKDVLAQVAQFKAQASERAWQRLQQRRDGIKLLSGCPGWCWGTQGIAFSPAMRRELLTYYEPIAHDAQAFSGFGDMVIHEYVYKVANCSAPGGDAGRCRVWGMAPSIARLRVQPAHHRRAAWHVWCGAVWCGGQCIAPTSPPCHKACVC